MPNQTTETTDNKTIKNLNAFLSLLLSSLVTIVAIRTNINTLFQNPFEITSCKHETEKHTDIEYDSYIITIEPPIELAKLCVQPYIRITYKKISQVILLENLYTQNAFISEEGTFPLLKKKDDVKLYKDLKERFESELASKNLNLDDLIIENDTILCFAYSETTRPGKYYTLNSSLPQKISRYLALTKLNSENGTYNIDISNFSLESNEFNNIIQSMLNNIYDYESLNNAAGNS